MRRKLAAGNWKMHGTAAALAEVSALLAAQPDPQCDMLICPPATLLDRMRAAVGTGSLSLGGQDCHTGTSGAYTGDISAEMLVDAGATYVILGHSERRADHAESSALVQEKAQTALNAGLRAVICIGETEAERDAGHTLDVIGAQMAASIPENVSADALVVAYEPVWAIGTGRTPTTEEIGTVHDFMRTRLEARFGPELGGAVRLLYGGSVKPGNAAEIFAVSNVDGALVGGASLKAADFSSIVTALSAA